MKVLIVEDNMGTRELIKQLLHTHCPAVESFFECDDGQDAIELFKRHQPDWILMDINLKKTSGLKATREIMELDENAKVVIVTLYDEPEFREEADAAGAHSYVLKDDLRQLIRILCDRQT
jgi:two-component system response regulator DegU